MDATSTTPSRHFDLCRPCQGVRYLLVHDRYSRSDGHRRITFRRLRSRRFFLEHLGKHRAVSAQTVSAYLDALRLLLDFASKQLRRTPSAISLLEFDAPLLLAFLDHLEKERG